MKKQKAVLLFIIILSLVLFFVSGWQISLGNFADFSPSFYLFGLPFGAFVWGDLFIFSLLWLVISATLLLLKKYEYLWTTFFIFWIIRSLGETFYWFLAQFNPNNLPWPLHFLELGIFKSLTDLEIYVAFQVFWQSITVLSSIGLIFQIKGWKKNK